MTVDGGSSLTPPLKWAGGKRWLAKHHVGIFPSVFETYYEPFVGGAAIFFHLQPARAVLSDANQDLITTYVALRDNWFLVENALHYHARLHSKKHFYTIRQARPCNNVDIAAWFIYLNRTCFNGLYRVNRRGEFNVPKGSKERVIFPYDNFSELSKVLSRATISTSDFEQILDLAHRGDFVYVDPPYTVKHNINGFLKYNEEIFSWTDQERLCASVVRAAGRGVKILVSNADHSSVRDLYGGVGKIMKIGRHSIIGGGAAYRSQTSEIAVRVGY